MERAEARATLEKRLAKLPSRAYGEYLEKLNSKTYKSNKNILSRNSLQLNATRKKISRRIEKGNPRIGNQGKLEKLTTIMELMKLESSSEPDESPSISRASLIAQKSAEKLAEEAIAPPPAEPPTNEDITVEITPPPKKMELLIPEDEEYINNMFNVLKGERAQKDLINLYSISQSEFTRNGKLTPDVGMSREKDLLAVLQEYLGDDIITELNNDLVEDFLYKTVRVSVKHKSGKVGDVGIKAKWTSDSGQAKKYIDSMIELNPKSYTHVIIVYIDLKSKGTNTVTLCFVTDKVIMKNVEELKRDAFISREGTNNRGVEYSSKMIKNMIANAAFKVVIDNVSLTIGLDPIARRRKLLEALR